MNMRGGLRKIVLLLTFWSISGTSTAAVILVPGEQPTIQQGINAAAEGDTVLVAADTYVGPMNRDLDFGGVDLVLLSEEGRGSAIIDCQGVGRGFYLHSGEDASSIIDGFTVTNGFHGGLGGAAYFHETNPTVRNCTFSTNTSNDRGGGVACYSCSPEITNCTFIGNVADGRGGALFCTNYAAPAITGCVFSGNSADVGGAIHFTNTASSPEITGCTFSGNTADTGGAIAFHYEATPVIASCTFSDNSGCAIYCESNCALTIHNTIVAFNDPGAGVSCWPGSSAQLTCCDVYGNQGGDWISCIADQSGEDGNMCQDPLFCREDNPEQPYSLHSDSDCAADNNPGCGAIGAWAVGCDESAVEHTSWGRVKSLYGTQ
jgi:predicted outer membrane repeat protein